MSVKITISLIFILVVLIAMLKVGAIRGAYAETPKQDILWQAICQVETGGHWQATDKPGGAGEIGIAQIRTVCVDDVNRILKSYGSKERYTYKDRLSVGKSKEMFYIYVGHYARYYTKTYGKLATDEIKARIWNGGPTGWNKMATISYWKKVKKELEK